MLPKLSGVLTDCGPIAAHLTDHPRSVEAAGRNCTIAQPMLTYHSDLGATTGRAWTSKKLNPRLHIRTHRPALFCDSSLVKPHIGEIWLNILLSPSLTSGPSRKLNMLSHGPPFSDINTWKDFENAVSTVLTLNGLAPQPDVRLQGRQTDIWCVVGTSLLSVRVIVECKFSNKASSLAVADITELASRLMVARASGAADFAWLITNQLIPANASSVIREAHLEGALRVMSLRQLLSHVLNIPAYLAHSIININRGQTGFIDPAVTLVDTLSGTFSKHSTFSSLLPAWLADNSCTLLVLLGDFGEGKTTCCEEILLQHDKPTSLSAGRVPLYIHMRSVANQGYSLPKMLRVCLHERLGLKYESYALLDHLAYRGNFLFIFDGLDEIANSLKWRDIYAALKEIATIAHRHNKILITSRPAAFPVGRAASDVMRQLSNMLPSGNRNTPTIVARLQPFDPPRIRQAIVNCQKYDVDAVLRKLALIHDLTELSSRPILLAMILESLDSFVEGDVVDPAALYNSYTSEWLGRDEWRSNVSDLAAETGRALKREFLERLSWALFTSGESEISSNFVGDCIAEFFKNDQVPAELLDAFENEVRACGFLQVSSTSRVVFAHRSFYQYFVAKYLSAHSYGELVRVISAHQFEIAIIDFLSQLIDWHAFLNSDTAVAALSSSPECAWNVLHASKTYNWPTTLRVTLPRESSLRAQSDLGIDLSIDDSDLVGVSLNSKDYVALQFRRSACESVVLGCNSLCSIAIDASTVDKLDVREARVVELDVGEGAVCGGMIMKCGSVHIRVRGDGRFRGLRVDEVQSIGVEIDGEKVRADMVKSVLRERGVLLFQKRSDKSGGGRWGQNPKSGREE
jgi:hypothetical protein